MKLRYSQNWICTNVLGTIPTPPCFDSNINSRYLSWNYLSINVIENSRSERITFAISDHRLTAHLTIRIVWPHWDETLFWCYYLLGKIKLMVMHPIVAVVSVCSVTVVVADVIVVAFVLVADCGGIQVALSFVFLASIMQWKCSRSHLLIGLSEYVRVVQSL